VYPTSHEHLANYRYIRDDREIRYNKYAEGGPNTGIIVAVVILVLLLLLVAGAAFAYVLLYLPQVRPLVINLPCHISCPLTSNAFVQRMPACAHIVDSSNLVPTYFNFVI